jgi:hypothetical protein
VGQFFFRQMRKKPMAKMIRREKKKLVASKKYSSGPREPLFRYISPADNMIPADTETEIITALFLLVII